MDTIDLVSLIKDVGANTIFFLGTGIYIIAEHNIHARTTHKNRCLTSAELWVIPKHEDEKYLCSYLVGRS